MDGAGRNSRHFLNKFKQWHFHSPSNEVIWLKKFSNYMQGLKNAILAIFQTGRALLVRPSRIPHRISKILFALGADEFLAMLKGKIRETPIF